MEKTELPELPEIEHLRRTLEPVLAGAVVRRVKLLRADVLHHPERRNGRFRANVSGTPGKLLAGGCIERLERRGKQLAIVAGDGRVVIVHLGMSGQLRFIPAGHRLSTRNHVHCTWTIESNDGDGRLVFRDPRRFGGLWWFGSRDELLALRWSKLGPDALGVSARVLGRRLGRTRRAIKAALLDQSLVAGIGNIYADESLFEAGIHPLTTSCTLERDDVVRLARAVRDVLRRAVRHGGSTIRSYVDANGTEGAFALRHRVYGRAGQACLTCGSLMVAIAVAQRTTVFCPRCQARTHLDKS